MQNSLLRVTDVARDLSISTWMVYDMIRKGNLPSIRVGRLVRVTQESLNQWVKNGGNKYE